MSRVFVRSTRTKKIELTAASDFRFDAHVRITRLTREIRMNLEEILKQKKCTYTPQYAVTFREIF